MCQVFLAYEAQNAYAGNYFNGKCQQELFPGNRELDYD